jgi:hypothetical protein
MSTTKTRGKVGRPFKILRPGEQTQVLVLVPFDADVKLRLNERVTKTGRRLPDEVQELVERGLVAVEREEAVASLIGTSP